MNTADISALSNAELQVRLIELEAVIQALRDHQVDAIVGNTDVALVHLRQVEEALRESGERYRAFVANSSEGIWRYEIEPPMPVSLDADAQVEYILAHGYMAECNDAMARMAGYERAGELVGARGALLTPYPGPRAALHQFVRSGYRIEQLEALRQDRLGNERWYTMSFIGLPHQGVLSRLWGVQRDITERKRAEENARQRTNELTALLAVTRELATTLDLEPLLDNVLSQLRTVIDFTGASVGMLQGDAAVVVAYDGPLPHDEVLGRNLPVAALAAFDDMVSAPRPIIFEDQTLQQLCPPELWDRLQPLPVAQEPSRAWLIAPLMAKKQLVGLLVLEHTEPQHFTPWHAHMAQAFADHAAVAIENARLYKEARLVAAISERQRLAADLHDSVTQSIYGISLAAHTALPVAETQPERVKKILAHIIGLADASFADVRSLIFELRPETLERHGLVAAIERQAQPLRVREQIALHFDLGKEPNCALPVKEAIYRIAQESLNNIGKHAGAKEVWVKLETVDDHLCLEVRDDGRGFDPTLDYSGHLGLQVMRERVERFGGALRIEARPGSGATVRATIPMGQ